MKLKPVPKKQQKVFKELIAATNAINHAWELICELHAKNKKISKQKTNPNIKTPPFKKTPWHLV